MYLFPTPSRGGLEGNEEKIEEPSASRGSKGGSVGSQEEQGHTEGKSMLTWDLWKQRLAGQPAYSRVMEGSTLPL